MIEFYAAEENHPGWRGVAARGSMLQLERNGQTLFIVATEDPGGTTIGYLVE